MFHQLLIKPFQVFSQYSRPMSGHGPRIFLITPSRWQWIKTKDYFMYYMWIGLITSGSIITGANILVGPAQLQDIPADRVPDYWEYYKHPITRFIARYIYTNPQQDYEKMMHYLYEEREIQLIRQLEKKVRTLMAERKDYKAWYYRRGIMKHHRASRAAAEYLESIRGD